MVNFTCKNIWEEKDNLVIAQNFLKKRQIIQNE